MEKAKRIILTAVLLVLTVGMANAEFRFGIKAGINVDKMHLNNEVLDSDNRCGFTGGVMTEFQIPIIGLCFDLSAMYTRMNSRLDLPQNVTGEQEKIENKGKDFLEIPLNVKYKFQIPAVAAVVKPYIFTGPSFAFRLNKDTFSAMKTKTCQVAWNVGIGLELVKHLQISGSYGFGVNNVFNGLNLVNAEALKVKNNYWTITAAYLF